MKVTYNETRTGYVISDASGRFTLKQEDELLRCKVKDAASLRSIGFSNFLVKAKDLPRWANRFSAFSKASRALLHFPLEKEAEELAAFLKAASRKVFR